MRIAFNALSVTNLSGRHVLLGHVQQILNASKDGERHLLLHHLENRDLAESLQGQLDIHECSAMTARWPGRWVWERVFLSRLLRDECVDVVFSPSGMITPGLKAAQICLAQNPWCFVPDVRRGLLDEIKAGIQRRSYRQAQRGAALMLFNSKYMKDLYHKNAGFEPKESLILHQGIDENIFNPSRNIANFYERRCEIVTVSVMARHKNIEEILSVLQFLHQLGLDAKLKLIGPWPDQTYKSFIMDKIFMLNLVNHIDILGRLSRKELYRHYSEARVFCLLSRCESFGIPAIEAQAFGTPAVVADCGGPPEIVGTGGIVVALGDLSGAAKSLRTLLMDQKVWSSFSIRARDNARSFRWHNCTRPLIDYFSQQF